MEGKERGRFTISALVSDWELIKQRAKDNKLSISEYVVSTTLTTENLVKLSDDEMMLIYIYRSITGHKKILEEIFQKWLRKVKD
jgi:hypothetical protein